MKYSNPEIPEGINTTETNPLKEFSLLISAVIAIVLIVTVTLSFFIERTAEYIPFEFEEAISQQVVDKIDNESNEVDDYLQALADKIIPVMNLPEGVSIKVHYVNDDMVNAMATLGGHIMVYRGLLEKLPNENALVMLLGHEIGHVKMRHPVKALGKGVLLSLLMSVVLGKSSESVASVISDTSMLTLLSFSRDQEQLSDEEGAQLMNDYYGHVNGATHLFEVLQQQSMDQYFTVPQFLNSHPNTAYRIKHLNEMAQHKNWVQQGDIQTIPRYIVKALANDKKNKSVPQKAG